MRSAGRHAITALVRELRCVQLDPLDPMGTNADLVAMARIDGVRRGDFHREVYEEGFEHFAKERCLLPADAFPFYAAAAPRRPTFRMYRRLDRIPEAVIESALEFVSQHGPVGAEELSLGRVEALNPAQQVWKGTRNAGRMALEVLVRQCRVTVAARAGRRKHFDIPSRHLGALGMSNGCGAVEFAEWAILERVRAAGLLSLGAGIWWSSIEDREVVHDLVAKGRLMHVRVEGIRAPLVAEAGVRQAAQNFVPVDHLRILGPLDPLLWNRRLVRELFDFGYLWEVYKPATQRRHGWYVMPLLAGEHLVGRLEGRVHGDSLEITNVWEERKGAISAGAIDECLAHHAWACGVSHFTRPKRFELG